MVTNHNTLVKICAVSENFHFIISPEKVCTLPFSVLYM